MLGESPGTLLAGRYRVGRRLGSGGVATVYLAEDERLGRQVALKRLRAGSPQDMARRFEREARLGALLNHPNLVAVYDITTETTELLIVMEYVEGITLAEALRDGPLPPGRALAVLRGVAAGLDHAHEEGVIHRDVKPANVLLGDDGRIKLADLGIATAAAASDITGTGALLGTPSYMAPEQLAGGDVGRATDVYGLATVAFEAFSGQKARSGRTPMEVAHRVTSEPPPDLRESRPDAAPALAEALRQAMAADPAERPASAGELVDRLAAAVGGDVESPAPVVPPPEAPPERGPAGEPERAPTRTPDRGPAEPLPPPASAPRPRSRWRRAAAVTAVALLGLAVALVLVLTGPATEAPPPPAEPEAGEPRRSADPAPAPEETVVDFYELAAEGDFSAAWALAGPAFRQKLGGFAGFQATLESLESIEFERAQTVEEGGDTATVAIETVATHTNRVDNCEGTLSLVADGESGWLIDDSSITCS